MEPFFVDRYDVFLKAPEGMFLAFVGPTLAEVATTPLHLITFLESMFLVAVLAYFVVRRLPSLPIYSVIMGFFITFWVMFPNYPLGVMNPGTAIRYRTGWIIPVIVVIAFLLSRELYVSWRGGTARSSAGRAKPRVSATG